MQDQNDEIHIEDDLAKAGETSGHMRWVLGIGTLLAIILMSIIWITGAATQGDVEEEATVSGELRSTVGEEEDGDNTDSIVGDDVADLESQAEAE